MKAMDCRLSDGLSLSLLLSHCDDNHRFLAMLDRNCVSVRVERSLICREITYRHVDVLGFVSHEAQ